MKKNSNILITGGTGSFGSKFVPLTLKKYNPKRLVIFSRDEMKQWNMQKVYNSDNRVRFFIGDVRDRNRLMRALDGIDYVIHAAATKIVPTAEYNPFECVKTNITGAMNVIDACLDKNIQQCVALSTDKASNPVNLYGATKLASDKMFVSANSYSGSSKCKFAVVRYGNVMGSRGSVIPYFIEKMVDGYFPITDVRMTRFMITLEEGVDLVWKAFEEMKGGEIFVKKIPSMKIVDIARAINPDLKQKIIGIRPGEKLHEQMIGLEDAPYTYEYLDHYRIFPAINNWSKNQEVFQLGKKVPGDFLYTSDGNSEWLSMGGLHKWLVANQGNIGTF